MSDNKKKIPMKIRSDTYNSLHLVLEVGTSVIY